MTMASGFVSFMAQDLEAFLAFKRARGSPYRRAEFTLRSFDRFVAAQSTPDSDGQPEGLFLGWFATMEDVELDPGLFMIPTSKGRSRIVPFGSDLAQQFRNYLDVGACQSDNDAGPLFVRSDGRTLSVRNASDTIRALLRRAGLKPAKGRTGPRPYDFRHSFASQLVMAGVPLKAVQEYLGHSDLKTTMGYAHLSPAARQGYVDVLDGKAWSQNGPNRTSDQEVSSTR